MFESHRYGTYDISGSDEEQRLCDILGAGVITVNDDTFMPCTVSAGNPDELLALAQMRMPYGTHKGKLLIDLPEHYVVWLAGEGFPSGKLGAMLQTVYDIKVNGLEYLFAPLRDKPRHK